MKSDKKRIVMLGYNFAPEPTGIGKYSGEMMDWLADHGHDCHVVTTYPYYPHWKVQEPYRNSRFWFKRESKSYSTGGQLKVSRCPIYVPKNPSGLKRMILDATFLMSSFFVLIKSILQKKPDVLIAVVPSFLIGLPMVFLRFLTKAKLVYHVQDMQIEAARDLGMIKSKGFLNTLFSIERFILKRCDVVSTISEAMMKKMEAKTEEKSYFFPNWVDVEKFHPLSQDQVRKTKVAYGFDPSDRIVLYSGGIGQKQGLEAILGAAQKLISQQSIKFIICGSGPYKEVLEQEAIARDLTNLSFLPLQDFDRFNAFLNMADLHLVIQKADAADLMLPSKLTTILAVGGVSLITANQGSTLRDVAEKYEMAHIVDAENQEALEEGIEKAIKAEETNQLYRENSRTYAQNFLDIRKVMSRFNNDIITSDSQKGQC